MSTLQGYRGQRGTSVLVVLVLLSVMLLGGITMARLSESSTMVSGNVTNSDIALQGSEVGLNTALTDLKNLGDALLDSEASTAGKVWYRPTMKTDKSVVSENEAFWDARPSLSVGKGGQFSIRYFVERLCTATPVTTPQTECMLRVRPPEVTPADGEQQVAPPSFKQYRITVRVEAPKQGYTFVQSVATKP